MKENYEIRTVCAGKCETDVLIFGSGENALLLLPGLSLGSVLAHAGAVARAYGCFSEAYTVYLPDRRKDPPAGYTTAMMAADTAAVTDALGLKTADVIGVSQGGMIALTLALERPALVRKLALCSSAAWVVPAAAEVLSRWMTLAAAGDAAALTASFCEKLFSPAFVKALGLGKTAPPPLTKAERTRFLRLAAAAEDFDVSDRLRELTCPVLALGAERDAVLTGEAVRETAELLHCARYFYPPPYGHGVYDEAPDFKQRLLRFFTGEDR